MATPQTRLRSISLPSRLHANSSPANVKNDLEKLKPWQISSVPMTTPISSETIQFGLLMLTELYNSVQELTRSPSMNHHGDVKSLEESLSASVDLLDACATIRELFQMIREHVQALQSALRRKGMDSSIQHDITTYLCFRKKMNNCIAKSLKTLKNMEQRNGSNQAANADPGNFTSVFREVTGVTIQVFKSILGFFSWPMTRPGGSWAFVSKLMTTRPVVSGRENDVTNEVGNVDFALISLQGKMRSNGDKFLDQLRLVQKRLHNIEAMVEGFEEGLERLFRQLVRSRVTLLNILTDN